MTELATMTMLKFLVEEIEWRWPETGTEVISIPRIWMMVMMRRMKAALGKGYRG